MVEVSDQNKLECGNKAAEIVHPGYIIPMIRAELYMNSWENFCTLEVENTVQTELVDLDHCCAK